MMDSPILAPGPLTRDAAVSPLRRELRGVLERDATDDQARTVPVVVSTDATIAGRFGRRERLEHTSAAVDFSFAARGLPLQVAHQYHQLPVGRVEDLRIDGSVMRGVARFSRSARGNEAWQDVQDGILTDVSIGADVQDEDWAVDGDVHVARKWRPIEASLVSVGADPGAGINRSEPMADTHTADAVNPVQRATEIAALFRGLDGAQWLEMERDALRGSDSVEIIRDRVLDALRAELNTSARVRTDHVDVSGGETDVQRFVRGATVAVEARMGLAQADAKEMGENPYTGFTLAELAREYLRVRGLSTRGSQWDVVGRAVSAPAVLRGPFSHSTSDFANLLASSSEKALHSGYAEAPETYNAWTRNVSMQSFRAHSFTALSLFSDLEQVREGAEYTHGTFSDRVESATLGTYGRLFSITRQAIVNDDLSAFSDIPMKMGRAAARQVGDLVYAVLTGDVKLSDQAGATLFNTTDGNLSSTGAAISTTTLGARRAAMRKRTDPSGATLNIRPRFLLVPAALETAAAVQLASEKDPSEGTTTSFDAMNPFRGAFSLVVEPRLDADSATQWYLLAAPGAEVETVVVGWLDGRQEPFLEQNEGFAIDGIEYKVRIDCVAKALDWRGMDSNAGA